MISFVLAQGIQLPAALDWKHVLLATAIPCAFLVGRRFANAAEQAAEAKLRAAGHPQAADALNFLARQFASIATEAEKAALSRAASAQGLDHPAIKDATDGKGL